MNGKKIGVIFIKINIILCVFVIVFMVFNENALQPKKNIAEYEQKYDCYWKDIPYKTIEQIQNCYKKIPEIEHDYYEYNRREYYEKYLTLKITEKYYEKQKVE